MSRGRAKVGNPVVSIPVIILWQVRMRLTQKLGIGVFLCLSICMIMIAAVRLSRIENTVSIWQYMWLQIEACVAVIMVALTAFRSVFSDNQKVEARRERRWYSSAVARNLKRRERGRGDGVERSWPALLPAAFLGERTNARVSLLEPGVEKDGRYFGSEAL